MKGITVLIVDNCEEAARQTAQAIEGEEEIKLLGIALDGKDAYGSIINLKPQVVIIEPDINKIDGFNLMSMVLQDKDIKQKPAFLTLTHINTPLFTEKAFEYGAESVMLKPADKNLIIKNIENSVICMDGAENIEFDFSEILCVLGISARLKGHRYIKTALKLINENDEVLYGITKNLYPEIAKVYSTTASGVERAIRNAIEVSWRKGDRASIYKIFGNTINPQKGHPTNYEMIAQLAVIMRRKKLNIS